MSTSVLHWQLFYGPSICLNMALVKGCINQCLVLQTEEMRAQLGRLQWVVSRFRPSGAR